jgi:diaminopimelate epimerase
MNLKFTKMQGAGNDFVVVDARKKKLANPGELAARICDRHFGVGADGLILVLPSRKADFRMRIFNSDGSEPEMCGNGIRCFARFLAEKKITKKTKLSVETLAGIIRPELADKKVRVDMGEPRLARREIPILGPGDSVIDEELRLADRTVRITAVSMGNPHAVIFVDNLADYPLARIGAEIESHPLFPKKTNVEFVEVVNNKALEVRVWERGAGETLACGTGACASLVAASLNGKAGRKANIRLPGGILSIEWGDDNRVYMTGPAESVFEGSITL